MKRYVYFSRETLFGGARSENYLKVSRYVCVYDMSTRKRVDRFP